MRILERLDESLWWETIKNCPCATFFHTPVWNQLVSDSYPQLTNASLGIELAGGTLAIVPLTANIRRLRPLQKKWSTFAWCYGDIIAARQITEQERHQLTLVLLSDRPGFLTITGNPFCCQPPVLHSKFHRKDDFTQTVDLTQGYDKLAGNYSRSCKKQIKKGRRFGFEVRSASSERDVAAYLEIYHENLVRWNKSGGGYSSEIFSRVLRMGKEEATQGKLWLVVEAGTGQIVGGTLVFYWDWHAVEWHGVFNRRYFQHGVRNYLVDTIIRDACLRGCSLYDFNPSGGHDGVVRFKESFGAEPLPFARWEYRGDVASMLRSIKSGSKYVRRLWK